MHLSAHRAGPTAPQGYFAHPPMNMAYAAFPMAPAPPMLQQKRTSESVEEDQAGPKAKKARATKAKAPESAGLFRVATPLISDTNSRTAQSRRNHSTKKRGDASQMPAQNGESGRRFVYP